MLTKINPCRRRSLPHSFFLSKPQLQVLYYFSFEVDDKTDPSLPTSDYCDTDECVCIFVNKKEKKIYIYIIIIIITLQIANPN